MMRVWLVVGALSCIACAPDKGPWASSLDSAAAEPDTAVGEGEGEVQTVPDGGESGLDAGDSAADGATSSHEDAGPLEAGSEDAQLGDATTLDAASAPDAASDASDGGARSDASSQCIAQDAATAQQPIDLIIALDTSGSMAPYLCNIATNLSATLDALAADTHVVTLYELGISLTFFQSLCGVDDPLANSTLSKDPTRYRHVVANVDSSNALSTLLSQHDNYRTYLRAGARTHFLVVTDDNSMTSAADFKMQMELKLAHGLVFHSVVADPASGCGGASAGAEYLTLSGLTGGIKQPLCSSDWQALKLGLAAASGCASPAP